MKNVSLLINLWFPHHNETFHKTLYMILLYIIIPCTVTAVTRCLITRAPAGRCKVVHWHLWILLFVFCRTLFSIHAQSLAQRRSQHLFYRVKYDSRCWCSTSRQKTEMRFNPSLVSEFPPPGKILRPPMPDKDSHSIAQTSSTCKLILKICH